MPYSQDKYSARPIDTQTYLDFVDRKVTRMFYNQLPETLEIDALHDISGELLGFYYDEDLVEVGKITFLPYLRLFKRTQLNWLSDTDDLPEHLPGIVHALEAHLAKNKSCLFLSICPLALKKLHEAREHELEAFDPSKGQAIHDALITCGYEHIDFDHYSHSAVQPQFIYVKDIRGMSEEEVFADLDSKVRSHMRVCERFNLQIRRLRPEEYEIFNNTLIAMAENYGFDKLRLSLISEEELALAVPGACKAYYAIYMNIEESLAHNLKMQEEIEAEIAANPGQSRREKQALHNLKQQSQANEKRRREIEELAETYPNEDELILGVSEYAFSKSDFICRQTAIKEEFVSLSPAYRLHALMIPEAVKQGMDYYNLFSVSDPSQPDDDEGVLRFKEQFHGYTEEYWGTYTKTLRDPLLAKILKALKNLIHR